MAYPYLSETQRKYPIVGSLADLLTASTSPERTQQARMLAEFFGLPSMATTLDRISYGEPLTTGTNQTLQMKPETAESLLGLVGMGVPAGKPTAALTKETGAALKPLVGEALESAADMTRMYAGPKQTGSKAAARNKKKTSTATVFDDVTDYDKAMDLARKGAHLKQDSSGQYIGGPRTEGKYGMTVDSPQALAAMRRSADQQVEEGLYNAAWYDRARHTAEEAAGGPNTSAALFARGGAAYSPQATPPTEINSFIRQHNAQVIAGQDFVPRTKSQAANVAKAYQVDPITGQIIFSPEKIRLGKKTGPYADAKDPTIPATDLYKTASDIWHGRVMGYSDAGGKQFSRGFTPQEHGFLTGENLLLADRAQQKMNAGLFGEIPGASPDFRMDPRAAQAATWGAGRERSYKAARAAEIAKFEQATAKWGKQMAKWENSGKKGKRPQKPVLSKVGKESDASIVARARAGIDDATKRNIGSLTYEYAPGENILPGASRGQGMEEFSQQMQAIHGNRDPYIDAMQGYQMNTLRAPGEYVNSLGITENQPAFVTRPLVGLENSSFTTATGKTGRGGQQIDAPSRLMMDTAAALRAVDGLQEGVGWNKFTPANSSMKAWEKTGVQFSPMETAAENAIPASVQLEQAKKALQDAGLDVIHVGDGLHAGRFDKDWDGKKVQEAVKSAQKGLQGRFTAGRFESANQQPPWATGPGPRVEGTGQVARYLEDRLNNSGVPNLAARLDAANVPELTAQQTDVINNFLKANNLTMPEDVAKLREIIGRYGYRGFLEYVQKNGYKGLPAAAPFGLMEQLESEQPQ